jgi:hypothetical protein
VTFLLRKTTLSPGILPQLRIVGGVGLVQERAIDRDEWPGMGELRLGVFSASEGDSFHVKTAQSASIEYADGLTDTSSIIWLKKRFPCVLQLLLELP